MSLHSVPVGVPSQTLRLKANAVAVPALASHVRPAIVLAERDSRGILEGAARGAVGAGGRFAAGPAGIQVWSGAGDSRPAGTSPAESRALGSAGPGGTAVMLGSVDWSFDTPAKGYLTITRCMVTPAGVDAGESPLSVLGAVLALAGVPVDGTRVSAPAPPARDPFRRPSLESLSAEQRASVGV